MRDTVLDVVLSYEKKSGRSCPKEDYRTIEGMRHLPRGRLRWNIIGIQGSFLSFAKADLERSLEEVALEHLSIGRIWRCVIEDAEKSFPAKEIIQEAQRRESMTDSGRKAKVPVWLQQGLLETWRNKLGWRESQVLRAHGQRSGRNIVQRLGLCPQEPTLRPGARAPSLQPARGLRARASTLKRSSPPRPGGRGHRRAPTLALSASSWGPPPSLGTHHSESEPPNAASTSPSSRHLSRFLVAEMLPRPRGKLGRRVPDAARRGLTSGAWELLIP